MPYPVENFKIQQASVLHAHRELIGVMNGLLNEATADATVAADVAAAGVALTNSKNSLKAVNFPHVNVNDASMTDLQAHMALVAALASSISTIMTDIGLELITYADQVGYTDPYPIAVPE